MTATERLIAEAENRGDGLAPGKMTPAELACRYKGDCVAAGTDPDDYELYKRWYLAWCNAFAVRKLRRKR